MSMSQSEVNSLLHQAATRLNNTFLNETTSYVQREVGWVASSGAQLFQERTHRLSNQAS